MAISRSKAIKEAQARAAERGRVSGPPFKVSDEQIHKVIHLGTTEAARKVGLSRSQYIARRRRIEDGAQEAQGK
jgi:hypothetical protein